jgi:hypothetical protein
MNYFHVLELVPEMDKNKHEPSSRVGTRNNKVIIDTE